jgi:hypothetical protein
MELNEYQRGFNDGLELAALKVQNLITVHLRFDQLRQIAEVLRDQKLVSPPGKP